jgi:NAD(P)-dependent dehydrogenase (short-subunit alcohol dehydrogenase family)
VITSTFQEGLLRGKRALVSGGTSGIGAAIGNALAELGAAVTVTGPTEEDAQRALNTSGFWPERAIALDVRDGAAVTAVVAAMPGLDILVNCAGIIRRDDEHDPAVFDEVIDVNLSGTMRMCAAARTLLAKTSGCIVNTASMLSFFGGSRVPAYSASKGGIAQLTKSLALAYAAEGIRVNAIAPGWIATALTAALRDDAERSAPILSRTPLARWGTPDDLIGAVVFLCSPAAAFITGAVLPVDGGYLAS